MSITLYYHPLSSYCQKAIIGLHELGVPFARRTVDLGDAAERAAFLAIAPLGKFPVIVDDATGEAIPESTILLEHVDRDARLFPSLAARAADRFWDLHVHQHVQTIVGDRLRPADAHDPFGVAHARAKLALALDLADAALRDHAWAAGDDFTIADCAAAPALFFAQKLVPIGARPHLAAYDDRLRARPSVARTFAEAAPYLSMFPG
jgi:glutathione S-transferase